MADDPGKTSALTLTLRKNDDEARKRRDAAFSKLRRKPNDPAMIEAYELANVAYEASHDRLVNATLTKEQIAYGQNLIARQKKQS
jgi:hypothetical protein